MNQFSGWCILVAGIWIAACTPKSQKTPQDNHKVLPVTHLVTRDTALLHEYVTDIQAVRNVEIRARVTGFIDKIYVDEGQEVKKGQPLFRINDEEYKSTLARARANLESAIAEAKTTDLEVDRIQLLVEKKVISPTELQVAQAKQKAAKSRIEAARYAEASAAIRLAYTNIRAPFDGIIDRIPLKTGSLVEEGTLLTTVSDIDEVYAYFNVSEVEYLEYLKSQKQQPGKTHSIVKLVLADGTPYAQPGKIETVEGEFDNSTGSIAFRARFSNPNELLKHGATGTILLANPVKDALLVPQKAVLEIQDKNYVFVVDPSNTVRMKNFTPLSRFSDFYIVKSGLEPGERIVYEGIQTIKDGIKVVPDLVPMDSLLARTP